MEYSLSKRILFVLSFVILSICAEHVWVQPNARYLPFPVGAGNKIQIIAGFGIPADIRSQSLSFGLILKTNYELPTNLSIFTEVDYDVRKNPTPTRWALFKTFESALERFSIGGRECLLFTICEAADATFGHDGILGEILHLLLMPSSSIEDEPGDPAYLIAEKHGQNGSNCKDIYPQCSANLLDIISVIREEGEHNGHNPHVGIGMLKGKEIKP